MLLGILTLHPEQEKCYFGELAKRAQAYGITVVRFVARDWEPHNNTVFGQLFDPKGNRWVNDVVKLPELIYDRCYYSNSTLFETYHPIVNQLKKKTTFLSTGLPNKWDVYRALKQESTLLNFLPQTYPIHKREDVKQLLFRHRQLVLKPRSGSQGKGMLFLKTNQHQVSITTHIRQATKSKTFRSVASFGRWLDAKLEKTRYIAQTFLPLLNEDNQPFDLRVLVQKDGNGKWQESGRGLRVGKIGSFISNLHNGGNSLPFSAWLSNYPRDEQEKILSAVDELVQTLPLILENKFGRLFEIGLDIGIEKNGKCWLLETNAKPGHQVILKTDPTASEKIYSLPLAYSQYLNKKPLKKIRS